MANSPTITIRIEAATDKANAAISTFFTNLNGGLNNALGASSFLEGLGAKLAAAFTVAGVVKFTKESIDAAEGLAKLAEKTGLTVSTLSGLKEQAQALDVHFEELQTSLGAFSDRLYTAATQGGQSVQVFRDLDIKLLNLDGTLRPAEQVLADVAERFKAMADGPRKTAAAVDLFGRAGREMIPILNEGAAGMERMRREGGGITPEMTAQAREFNRGVRDIQDSFEKLFRGIVFNALPALREFVALGKDGILAFELGKFGEFFELSMKSAIQSTSNFMMEQISKWSQELDRALNKTSQGGFLSKDAFKGYGTGLLSIWDEFGAMLGIPGARELADKRVEQTNEFFKKAGIADGILNQAAEAFVRGTEGLPNEYKAALEKFRVELVQLADKRRIAEAGIGVATDVAKMFGGSAGQSSSGQGAAGVAIGLSESAKALVLDLERTYAQATQSKLALLDIEEKQLKVRIPMISDTHSENNRTPIRDCRTVVGA